jgi:hypothetical protein
MDQKVIKQFLRKAIEDPLSDDDIKYLTRNKCNIMKYEELAHCETLDQVLKPHGACILLYETEKNFGHWVALIKNPGGKKDVVEFFDSYGMAPDEELKMIPQYFRATSAQNFPHLTQLINESPYQVQFNDIDFQEEIKNVNTCGRWAAMRVIWRNISLDKFQDFLLNQRISPDEYVAAMTMDTMDR